jgi:c-di-GMP-binding flagellar brake protein YcgR
MSKERRRFPRVHEPVVVQYRVSGREGAWGEAHVINISAGGLRFRCADERPDTNAVLQVQVALPDGSAPATLTAQVTWSQLMASGVTEVGVEFQDIETADSLLIERVMGLIRNSA